MPRGSRGTVATAAGVAPYGTSGVAETGFRARTDGLVWVVALNFYFYEGLKARFITAEDSATNRSLRTLMCGAGTSSRLFSNKNRAPETEPLRRVAAGSVAQTLTYPFDVLRRKMQVAGMNEFSPAYTGALDAMIKITRAEGWWAGM